MKSLSEIVIEKIPDAFDPDEILPARAQYLVSLERRGFIAGASYMTKELLRWRDPEVELPDSFKFDWVLLRVQHADGFIGIPKIGELRSDGLWHCTEYDDLKLGESFEAIYGCKVIGWRPLEEELLATE